jgi:putative transposase
MGKKVKGRKRHILVDTMGNLLTVVVHSAGIQDRDGARQVFARAHEQGRLERMGKVFADNGYWHTKLNEWIKSQYGEQWELEVVVRGEGAVGFEPLPKRWVVERTFAWLGRNRRLSREYEYFPASSEAFIYLAMARILLRRLAHSPSSPPSLCI